MWFRDAVPSDVPAIVHLVNAAYRSPGATPGWTDERHLLEGRRTDAAQVLSTLGRGRILVMELEPAGPIVGCCGITPDDDGAWSLSAIAVDPSRQGAGFGRAILTEVEDQARAAGCRRLLMTVIQQRDTLIAWYERRGYRRTGGTSVFPYHDPSVGTPLRNDLVLVALEKRLGP